MSTLYEKRGNRYVPVAQETTCNHLSEGYYLVKVEPGQRSMFRIVEPDHIALIAAAKDALDAMCKAMNDARWREPDTKKTRRVTPSRKASTQSCCSAVGVTCTPA